MATSISHRAKAHPRRAVRAKSAQAKPARVGKPASAKPAVHRRRKMVKARRTAPRPRPAAGPATTVLKSFAKLLASVRASAAHLTAEQRVLLKRAMKRAHAALD